MKARCFSPWLLMLISAHSLFAHDARPVYLQISGNHEGEYHVFLKAPLKSNMSPDIFPVVRGCSIDSATMRFSASYESSIVEFNLKCEDGIAGKTISLEELENYRFNVLVQVNWINGHSFSALAPPGNHQLQIPMETKGSRYASSYIPLGVEHILFGVDHLLFVFGLLLIVSGWKNLIKTVTAFTLAHSITLSSAVLGFVKVPQAPVEAAIALSIVFLAVEIIKFNRGDEVGLISRMPWLVAFSFGLLHGFGFAGALAEIGLPQDNIPAALFLFNVGIEMGQLMFIAVMLPLFWLLKKTRINFPAWIMKAPAYGIGSLAAYWMIQRALIVLSLG